MVKNPPLTQDMSKKTAQPGEYSGRRDSVFVACWTPLARRH